MKIFTGLLITSSLLFGSYIGGGKNKSDAELINYYNDGVYDTISQINKEIAEGVNKEELKDVVGKIAVLTPLQNVSTVDLIFYKTLAAKINLFNATTVIDETGIPYMLWDLKQREIDSQFIIQKLTERNIPVTSRTVIDGHKFFREPVLIKEFVSKITNSLKNVETKVAVVQNTTYTKEKITKFEPVEVAEKIVFEDDTPKNREYQLDKIETAPSYNNVSFSANTANASRFLRIGKNNILYYKINKITNGLKLGNFTVADVRIDDAELHKKYFITYEEDNKKTEYLLYTIKKPKVAKKIEAIETVSPQVKKTETIAKKTSKYKCDFKNIKMAISKDGKPIKIDSSNLFYNKVVELEAVRKIDSNYLMTNFVGLPEILLSEKYLNNTNYCNKAN